MMSNSQLPVGRPLRRWIGFLKSNRLTSDHIGRINLLLRTGLEAKNLIPKIRAIGDTNARTALRRAQKRARRITRLNRKH